VPRRFRTWKAFNARFERQRLNNENYNALNLFGALGVLPKDGTRGPSSAGLGEPRLRHLGSREGRR
jgi:hypothetical protein